MNARRYDWVFLDMDGTLADTLPLLYEAYSDFLNAYGKAPARAEFEALNGPALPEIVAALKTAHGLAKSEAVLLEHYHRLLMERLARGGPAIAGAGALVDTLTERGYRLMLVTSSPATVARAFVSRHGWANRFEAIVSGEHVERAKPDPAIYQHALEQSGAQADRAVVIEDAVNGVRAAVAAGMTVIGVACNHDASTLVKAGAERVAPDLHALRNWIEEDTW